MALYLVLVILKNVPRSFHFFKDEITKKKKKNIYDNIVDNKPTFDETARISRSVPSDERSSCQCEA